MKTNRKSVLVAIRLTPKEMQMLLAKAIKYTQGNVSMWLREAAFTYKRGK